MSRRQKARTTHMATKIKRQTCERCGNQIDPRDACENERGDVFCSQWCRTSDDEAHGRGFTKYDDDGGER